MDYSVLNAPRKQKKSRNAFRGEPRSRSLALTSQQQEPGLPRERPILFSAEMVRAILDGRKTQTRRVLGIQPLEILTPRNKTERALNQVTRMWSGTRTWFSLTERGATIADNHGVAFRCKYGEVGDHLWVRETWNVQRVGIARAAIGYRAGGDLIRDLGDSLIPTPDERPAFGAERRWRSPIHMPRWASRITLEITAIRIERVQQISLADAKAEGTPEYKPRLTAHAIRQGALYRAADELSDYRHLWNSINEKRGYGWDANPWVWVIEFRRLSA